MSHKVQMAWAIGTAVVLFINQYIVPLSIEWPWP